MEVTSTLARHRYLVGVAGRRGQRCGGMRLGIVSRSSGSEEREPVGTEGAHSVTQLRRKQFNLERERLKNCDEG